MSKALKSKSGRYFTITLSVVVIFISTLCWGKLIHQNCVDEMMSVENSAFSNKTKSTTKFGSQYMIITGVITSVVNYLPFKSNNH